ncbi:MAG: FAD-dependent oxidoreductase [Rhodothermales bacterium]
MNALDHDVVIVGGGPAGSSAAAHLAREGHDVLLLEKASFPRQKLCGEFLSTEVAGLCSNLGVLNDMVEAGARRISTLELTGMDGPAFRCRLPGTAYALSRRSFDNLLFQHARRAGAHACDGESVRSIHGDLQQGFRVETDSRTVTATVVLGAYGRRSRLDRHLQRGFLERQTSFVGFKAPFSGPVREGTIELHTFDMGYCGLIGDECGTVNVCWLARADRLREAGGSPESMLGSVLSTNPHLRARFGELDRVGAFLAVGQLSFMPKSLFVSDVCMIGDAAGMIAPLCGDGMGMALRSGEMAASLVDAYLSGRCSAGAFKSAYRTRWTREFAMRMRIGRWLNGVLTRSTLSTWAVKAARRAPRVAGAVISATRG